jgi:hypothetical protein
MKTFYTERDIEDMARRGVTVLEVNDDVVLTELAREKAGKLGLTLKPVKAAGGAGGKPAASFSRAELARLVKEAVIARVGPGLSTALIDEIINKTLDEMGYR